MNSNRKKILVALDGSGHAFDTVRYLSQVLPPDRVELVLFSVLTKKPERFWDTEENHALRRGPSFTDGWEIQQKKAIQEFMKNARQLLMDRSFPIEAVTVKTQERKVGISSKLIGSLTHIPLWLVGNSAQSKKYLLP